MTQKALISILLLGMIGEALIVSGYWSNFYQNGKGYTSKSWKDSKALQYIFQNPEMSFFTNGKDVFKLYFPRTSLSSETTPFLIFPHTMEVNPTYDLELSRMKNLIEEGSHQLIYSIKYRGGIT